MQQHKFAVLMMVTVILALSTACGWSTVRGSGRVAEETRDVRSFSEVTLSDIGNLYIEFGDETVLRIEAEHNLLPYFETEVRDDRLTIGVQRGVHLRPRKPVNFYLTVEHLDALAITGTGNIFAPDLKADVLSLKISGSGNLDAGDIRADDVSVRISGSGNVALDSVRAETVDVHIGGSGNLTVKEGRADAQEVVISGMGRYEAGNVRCNTAEVRVSGSGNVTLDVRKQLDVTISGSGTVRYAGEPTVAQHISGSGSIQPIED